MMIELTPYDGHYIRDEKMSVMVARIVSVEDYPRGNTAWVTLDTGKSFQVLESRERVKQKIQDYLDKQSLVGKPWGAE